MRGISTRSIIKKSTKAPKRSDNEPWQNMVIFVVWLIIMISLFH